MSKISSVSAGNGTATIYADVLKACDVVKLPTFVSGVLDNPFTPEVCTIVLGCGPAEAELTKQPLPGT